MSISELNKSFSIDARILKIIVLISMLIDHMGYILFNDAFWMRAIGRLAFPICCFLLIEGFYHTHDLKMYMLRLIIFAVISEIPFNLAISNQVFDFSHQNVFLTLAIGLTMLWVLNEREHLIPETDIPDIIVVILIIAAAGITAELLHTDYGFSGIAIIFIFYELKDRPIQMNVLLALIFIMMGTIEGFAIFSLFLIALYNGKRPDKTKLWQYSFYIFYPVHMLVLWGIKTLILYLQ